MCMCMCMCMCMYVYVYVYLYVYVYIYMYMFQGFATTVRFARIRVLADRRNEPHSMLPTLRSRSRPVVNWRNVPVTVEAGHGISN